MSQSVNEIAKELTIAAIQNGVFTIVNNIGMNAEEANKANAQEIGKYYKEIANSVNDAFNGKFD